MTELKSSLPFEEVKEAIAEEKRLNTMTITTVLLDRCKSTRARLNMEADGVPLDVVVYEIDNEKVLGYLPSKVWWHTDEGLELLYYVSPALPQQARPFGDEPVYCFYTLMENQSFTYDATWRVFLDQVQTPAGTLLVCMFNKDLYEHIVREEI